MIQSLTVVAPTSLRINAHAIAIQRTAALIPIPTRMLLLVPTAPTVPFAGEWRPIPDWMPDGKWSIQDFCEFLIHGLADHIETDACITVHWDGYAVHADRWTDEFLEYDYIGAPWPPSIEPDPALRVGNGGFSLRSRRWLDAGRSAPAYAGEGEDVFCCRKHLGHYQARGCRVAPMDLALRFSVEHQIPEHPAWPTSNSFGFHGWFHPDRDQYRIREDGPG